MSVYDRLSALGIALPPVTAPAAAYLPLGSCVEIELVAEVE